MSDLANTPAPLPPLDADAIAAWLTYELEPLFDRRGKLIAALAADNATPISDDDMLGMVAENMKMAAALSRLAEDRRREHKAPFLAGGATVDAWFKRFAAPLGEVMASVQTKMNTYGQAKLAAERARAEALRRDAQAEADRLAAAAAAAIEAQRPADAVLDRAADAAAAAAVATARAEAPAPDLTRVRGMYNAVASVRETWSWEIEDEDRIPRAYLVVDPERIKRAAKERDASGKPTRNIPGIRWVSSTKVGVR